MELMATQASNPPTLRVKHMRVIWRDTFIVENAPPRFLEDSLAKLRNLPCTIADTKTEPLDKQPEMLRIVERVSKAVAVIGYPDLLRFQFAPFTITSLRPTLGRLKTSPQRLTEEQICQAALEADGAGGWIGVTPMLLLHRAGVGTMEYHVALESPQGYTPEEAIDLIRLGIHADLITLPDSWRCLLPDGADDWPVEHVMEMAPDQHLLVCGLRDLSQGVLAARLGMKIRPMRSMKRLRLPGRKAGVNPHAAPVEALPPRPTGSTSVVLVDVDPLPGSDLGAYCELYAPALRGIGAMDADWRHRAGWLVKREMGENLSTDSEMAFFLLGNSELMLFNEEVEEALAWNRKHLRLKDPGLSITYFYMHYGVLMEWVYIQEAILRAYLQRLDSLAASPTPQRRRMISTLQRALNDLIQYQENITPYSTRIEFLERAHVYRKLTQLAERFERKQEMLLDYAQEYHDYREARATEFLNWLAGILTGAALADLIITLGGISPGVSPQETAAYIGITVGSIVLVLAIMALLLRRV